MLNELEKCQQIVTSMSTCDCAQVAIGYHVDLHISMSPKFWLPVQAVSQFTNNKQQSV